MSEMPRPRIDPELERLLDEEERLAKANPDLNSYHFRGEDRRLIDPTPPEPLTDLEFGAQLRMRQRHIEAAKLSLQSMRNERDRLEEAIRQAVNIISRDESDFFEFLETQGKLSNSVVEATEG